MPYLAMLGFIASALPCLLFAADYPRPDGVESANILSSASTYTPELGRFTVPSVRIMRDSRDGTPEQMLLNVEMQHRGGNNLEVVATTSAAGFQSFECTVAEVRDAIPQLNTTLTLGELFILAGCQGSAAAGPIDFETGKLLHYYWIGYDGIPNTWIGPPHYLHSLVVNPFPATHYIPVNFVSSGTAATRPSITVSYREGVIESYSFSTGEPFADCANELLSGFRNLQVNFSVEAVVAALGCEGNTILTTRIGASEAMDYQWRFISSQSGGLTEVVSARFLDDRVERLNLSSRRIGAVGGECSNEDFVALAQAISVGDAITDPAAAFNCGTRYEYFSNDGSTEEIVYEWFNGRSLVQFLTTPNRKLAVETKDGAVTKVTLSRF